MGLRALGRASGLIDASLKCAKFRASVLNLGAPLEASSSRAGLQPVLTSPAPAQAWARQGASAPPPPDLDHLPGQEGAHSTAPCALPCLPMARRPDHSLCPQRRGPGSTISSGFRSMYKTSCGSGWQARCFVCSMRSKATSMSAGTCAWPGTWPAP